MLALMNWHSCSLRAAAVQALPDQSGRVQDPSERDSIVDSSTRIHRSSEHPEFIMSATLVLAMQYPNVPLPSIRQAAATK